MKLQKTPLILAACLLLFAACEREAVKPDVMVPDETEALHVISEAEANKILNEVQSNAFYDQLDIKMISLMVRLGNGRVMATSNYVPSCANVTYNSETRTTTVDFGTGCKDVDGREHKGKIIINNNESLYNTGASATVKLENYSVDTVQVEGTRTITNVTADSSPNLQFTVELRGGKLTWPDGTFALHEANHLRTWIRAESPENDEWHIEGNGSGTNREGQEYTSTISNTLVFKMACRPEGVIIPVTGLKVIARPNESDATLDYGNGSCDNDVTITVDGSSKIVTVGQF